MHRLDEEIVEGDTEPEVDVAADQGEVDWSGQPSSDERLAPEVRAKLGLPDRP